ncbi:hypothetical protein TGDOM2_249750 [Toxoplasma gondii GAB2-2007-GAL-DOM2]|uniref:Uncharacterized protein n=6 Tax=Toxoplasma gondii TaxID=5811 RepID=S7W8X4_TOXGG|nr:hypothetical protein TGGT1_249750 [Toxoplasma gondii GT1]KAF4638741.1 hypothetical protein TGRH88_063500 [Toxoplasma gondii]KFG29296.1 hypothetical protein TGFOU_249750 [Toxoplasma gondii FOU]KFG46126.1 hypothetical protein TGDOM2_249750 [Toxoplasma gondii GAB2-2007-GAL-DOM2]KFG48935.1 hypothetical protein TGP89_249750 [Toxoplasma gondii p89]RQX70575.1 hypothetical protein TGCAST_249750 [Toxoplasma gondii CAST]
MARTADSVCGDAMKNSVSVSSEEQQPLPHAQRTMKTPSMEFVIKEPLLNEASGDERPETFLEIDLADADGGHEDMEWSLGNPEDDEPVPLPVGKSDRGSIGEGREKTSESEASSTSPPSPRNLDWWSEPLPALHTQKTAEQKCYSPFMGSCQNGLRFSLWSWSRTTEPPYKPEECWTPWEDMLPDRLSDDPEVQRSKSHYAALLEETQAFIDRARKPSALSLYVLFS